MRPRCDDLLPAPRQVRDGGAPWRPGPRTEVRAEVADRRVGSAFEKLLADVAPLGVRADAPPEGGHGDAIHLDLRAAAFPAQGYRLTVDDRGVRLVASDAAGLFYGLGTLRQWLALHRTPLAEGDEITGLEATDAPDVSRRGVLLDISRDKVPTSATLEALADRLASWKINQLQLYTEHTFAYAGHEDVWRDASPLTGAEARDLDRHCRDRFIELVPNQNSFGHFHRWLIHDAYKPLAEAPQGVCHAFSDVREPFSLCATDPRSLALLGDLYDQLLPHFESGLFNVGLDETFDLGLDRSAAACNERGRHEVYLEFLGAVARLVRERGRRMMFWADIVGEKPELLARVPPDAVALEWGYEADHPFGERARRLAASGLDFYLCPGTSSWRSFAGRLRNALDNLRSAAAAGRDAGAAGYLITDWGDLGHLQPLPVSYAPFLAGAAQAWSGSAGPPLDEQSLARALDRQVFGGEDGGLGTILTELGNVYLHTGTRNRNGSALFYLVVRPHDDLEHPRYTGLTEARLESALERVEDAAARLARSGRGAEAERTRRELEWVAAALALGCRLGLARLARGRSARWTDLPREARLPLAAAAGDLLDGHREVWLARNRPGGRSDSAARLERLRSALRDDVRT